MSKTRNFSLSMRLVTLCLVMPILCCSCADLAVKNIHSDTFSTQFRMFKATVKNEGMTGAAASKTSVQKADNPAGPYTQVSAVSTAPLSAGQEIELQLMPDYGNCVHLRVCADTDDVVNEGPTGEGNNCTTKSMGCQ